MSALGSRRSEGALLPAAGLPLAAPFCLSERRQGSTEVCTQRVPAGIPTAAHRTLKKKGGGTKLLECETVWLPLERHRTPCFIGS
eukprot:1722539-Rhodomonas_salina.2